MTQARKKSIHQPSPPKAAGGADGSDQRWRVAGLCLVLVAITFAVFGQTLHHEFVNFDDDLYVYENAKVAGGLSLKGLAWIFTHTDCDLYHPLTMLSLMGDYQLHGLRASGYHFTNVLLHTASAILLFLVLRQMTGALWRSAFVAAVFAIHPLRVESVAWVAERKDMLSGFFFMLTLGAYARYVRQPNSLARYLMVAAAFLLALLSKPTVVTLPFVLLLLDYWPLRRVGPRKLSALILEKIPLLALAAGACAMTVRAAGKWITPNTSVSILSRIGNVLVSYAVYLRQMVWPEGLATFYPQLKSSYPFWTIALSFLLLALITGGVLAFRRKRRWLLAGWLWYLGMLMPMIGLVQVGKFAHADRMTYLPQIGIYLALTWLAAEWGEKWQVSRAAIAGLMTGVLVVLATCAWKQTAYWRNSETMWTHTLECTTGNDIAHNSLGLALLQKGNVDAAITQFGEALQINSDYADAHNNMGIALRQKGRLDDAIAHLQKALQIKPDYAQAYNNLGIVLDEKGTVDEAIAHYQKALQIDSGYAEAHINLGVALDEKGKVDEAIAHFQKALEINPNYAGTHYNLGLSFFMLGRMAEAIAQYQKALEIRPDYTEARNNLAWVLATCPESSLRNGDKAVELARQAYSFTGGEDPMILHTLAAAFAETGQFSKALETAQRALHLAEAQSNTSLCEALQLEMKFYQAGKPFHSPAQTH